MTDWLGSRGAGMEAIRYADARAVAAEERAREAEAEVALLQAWVDDLHSGMFINCVYCGHRYGPDPGTPVAMAEVLRRHVEKCPKHPMSAMREALETLRDAALVWHQRGVDAGVIDPYDEGPTGIEAVRRALLRCRGPQIPLSPPLPGGGDATA